MFYNIVIRTVNIATQAHSVTSQMFFLQFFFSLKGLSKCKMKDEMPVNPSKNTVDVQTLKPDFKLCCTNKTACALCLVIDIEFNIDPDEDTEDQGSSGSEMEEYREDKITSQGI